MSINNSINNDHDVIGRFDHDDDVVSGSEGEAARGGHPVVVKTIKAG